MRRYVIYTVILLIGVVVALHNINDITVYAKENDGFLTGEGQSITRIHYPAMKILLNYASGIIGLN